MIFLLHLSLLVGISKPGVTKSCGIIYVGVVIHYYYYYQYLVSSIIIINYYIIIYIIHYTIIILSLYYNIIYNIYNIIVIKYTNNEPARGILYIASSCSTQLLNVIKTNFVHTTTIVLLTPRRTWQQTSCVCKSNNNAYSAPSGNFRFLHHLLHSFLLLLSLFTILLQ